MTLLSRSASKAVSDNDNKDDNFVSISPADLPVGVFRANDIRGIAATEITPQFARQLARAFAVLIEQAGHHNLCICRDGRLSSPDLGESLKLGLLESGCRVVDLGCGPTPLLGQYIATQREIAAGIMITASHNDKEYNGFKIIFDSNPFCGEQIQDLRESMARSDFRPGQGELLEIDPVPAYLRSIKEDISDSLELRICIDGGNGAAGPLAIESFQQLGAEVIELYCEIDGNFPNHGPDPCQSINLNALSTAVVEHNCHFGIALDGDGDRVVAVDELGRIVSPDQLYLIFAQDIMRDSQNTTLVFDVKASRQLASHIKAWGGNPLMEKSGRTFIHNRVRASGALMGGEYSSHYFFQDRWNTVDDGIYAACRLAQIIQSRGRNLSEILGEFPGLPATEELEIAVAEEQKTAIFEKFRQNAAFPGADLIEIDGLRIEYPTAWGLVRVSNTGPKLSVRFEGETEQALAEVQQKVREAFEKIDSKLHLPF